MLKNKLAIICGVILATLDFLLLGGYLIYSCATNAPSCQEGYIVGILHIPTIYIFFPIIKLTENYLILSVITAIAGIIQYFLLGYLLGYIAFLIKTIVSQISSNNTKKKRPSRYP